MSAGLPEALDATRLAPLQTQLSGRVELGRLRRLSELLATRTGAVEVDLACGRSADGRLTLEGSLRANLGLVCQRCLETVSWPVEATLAVAIVENEADSAQVAPPFEPVLLVDGAVPLWEVIEDELLLGIPIAPMHADPRECGALAERLSRYRAQPEKASEHRPFAELGQLADELHRRRK